MSKRLKHKVGDKIKFYRKYVQMTQDDLAKRMGMARTTIVAIEKNERHISDTELDDFEVALKLRKGVLLTEPTPQPTAIHVYFGYHIAKRERGEKCFYCGAKPPRLLHTYFGAPLCASCWDNHWRKTEEGESDPPSEKILNTSSGVWL